MEKNKNSLTYFRVCFTDTSNIRVDSGPLMNGVGKVIAILDFCHRSAHNIGCVQYGMGATWSIVEGNWNFSQYLLIIGRFLQENPVRLWKVIGNSVFSTQKTLFCDILCSSLCNFKLSDDSLLQY